MSFLNYFKEITISWRLSLFAVVFCIWPMSAYLIFHYEPQLFTNLDLAKLTLLASAISSPILVINTALAFLLISPKDQNLRLANTSDQQLSGAVLAGISMTLLTLSAGACFALVNNTFNDTKIIMCLTEAVFLLTVIWSKRTEDRRFRRANQQTENAVPE